MARKSAFNDLKMQEREARKNHIIDAAERVFADRRFDQISMKKIAMEAGISPGSIYTYFSDQEHLFVEAFLRGVTNLENSLRSIIDSEGETDIHTVIDAFLDYFNEHDAYFRMMAHFMLYGKLGSDAMNKLNSMMRSFMKLFDTIFLQQGCPEADVRLLSHTFFSALNGIMINFRRYPGRSEEEIVSHMRRLGKIVASLFSTYAARGGN